MPPSRHAALGAVLRTPGVHGLRVPDNHGGAESRVPVGRLGVGKRTLQRWRRWWHKTFVETSLQLRTLSSGTVGNTSAGRDVPGGSSIVALDERVWRWRMRALGRMTDFVLGQSIRKVGKILLACRPVSPATVCWVTLDEAIRPSTAAR